MTKVERSRILGKTERKRIVQAFSDEVAAMPQEERRLTIAAALAAMGGADMGVLTPEEIEMGFTSKPHEPRG